MEDDRAAGPLSGPTEISKAVTPRGANANSRATAAPVTSVTVAQVAILLAGPNAKRKTLSIVNTHATDAIYVGPTAALTTANGWPVLAGAKFTDTETVGSWYAIKVATTADVRVLQTSGE